MRQHHTRSLVQASVSDGQDNWSAYEDVPKRSKSFPINHSRRLDSVEFSSALKSK